MSKNHLHSTVIIFRVISWVFPPPPPQCWSTWNPSHRTVRSGATERTLQGGAKRGAMDFLGQKSMSFGDVSRTWTSKTIGYTGKFGVFNQVIKMTKKNQRWCWEPQMTKNGHHYPYPRSPVHVIHRMNHNDACNMLNSYPKKHCPGKNPKQCQKGRIVNDIVW